MLELDQKKNGINKMYSVTFKSQFIQQKEKLTVVTCQNRAWMDTAGVAFMV